MAEYLIDHKVARWVAAESEYSGEHQLVESHQTEAGVQLLQGMVVVDQANQWFQSIG